MASSSQSTFSLSKRRSNSSPQLQCEATDFSSILTGTVTSVSRSTATANSTTSTWSECNDAVVKSGKSKSFKVDNVTQASVHWLEPKQRAVLHNEPVDSVVVKPKTRSAASSQTVAHQKVDRAATRPRPDSSLLRCNETIHYLQGSDSDSESSLPGSPRRKSHACIQKRRTDGSQKFKRFSRAASQILSKLKIHEIKHRKGKETRKVVDKSDDGSDSETEQPDVRRRSRSLTSKVLKRFGSKEDEMSPELEGCTAEAAQPVSPSVSTKVKTKSKHCSKAGVKSVSSSRTSQQTPLVNFAKFDPEKYPIECTEEIERAAREREIEEGIDLQNQASAMNSPVTPCTPPAQNVHDVCGASGMENSSPSHESITPSTSSQPLVIDAPTHTTEDIYDLYGSLTPSGTFIPRTVHTQIDYMHCLVPEQWNIMKSSFYWGKIDRYEADNLLDNKPEGTFLLRDSVQEEFLFSVSFCRYGRTLHARIEQWNHKFSFDAHDPGVYSSDTICGLLEHYKDPNYCMFFEPMLTNPLPRVQPPSLLELSRAQICTHVAYDSICYLKLPNSLKEFLREYHYKQRVRIRRVEVDMPQLPQIKQSVVTNTCISR